MPKQPLNREGSGLILLLLLASALLGVYLWGMDFLFVMLPVAFVVLTVEHMLKQRRRQHQEPPAGT